MEKRIVQTVKEIGVYKITLWNQGNENGELVAFIIGSKRKDFTLEQALEPRRTDCLNNGSNSTSLIRSLLEIAEVVSE